MSYVYPWKCRQKSGEIILGLTNAHGRNLGLPGSRPVSIELLLFN